MDRYINMFINMVIRRLMTLGINKGIDAATNGRKKAREQRSFCRTATALEIQREYCRANGMVLNSRCRAKTPRLAT